MGLDCTAYEKVELVEAISFKEMKEKNWEHPLYGQDGVLFLWNMEDFVERGDGLVEGMYRSSGEEFGWRAGSYSGYSEYRRLLAKLVGTTVEEVWAEPDHPSVIHTPFYEQINFADNEGFLGPKTCAKLLADYKQYDEQAKTVMGDYGYEIYQDWIKALEIAAKGGVIEFH